jgi:hypothetical protein
MEESSHLAAAIRIAYRRRFLFGVEKKKEPRTREVRGSFF